MNEIVSNLIGRGDNECHVHRYSAPASTRCSRAAAYPSRAGSLNDDLQQQEKNNFNTFSTSK